MHHGSNYRSNLGNTPLAAAHQLVTTLTPFGELDARKKSGLALSMHGTTAPASEGMMRMLGVRQDALVTVSGTSTGLIRGLRSLLTSPERFDYVLSMCELHHCESESLEEVLALIRKLIADRGIFFFVDYAFKNVDREAAKQLTDSDAEAVMIEKYGGLDSWLSHHRQFGDGELKTVVGNTNGTRFSSLREIKLPARRELVIASETVDVDKYLDN